MVILKRTQSSSPSQFCNAIQMRPEMARIRSWGKRRRRADDLGHDKRKKQRWLSACDQSKKWDALDHELLVQIFSRVPSEDVLVNVFWVCPPWKSACFAALFWSRNVLDLSALDAVAGFYRLKKLHARRNSERAWKFDLMKLLRHILWDSTDHDDSNLYHLSAWRQSIQAVIFPEHINIRDEHLIFVAERTPLVQRVFLKNCWGLNHGIEKAVQLWKCMKELQIVNPDFSGYIPKVASFGKHLEILNVRDSNLYVMGDILCWMSCLPKLKKLTFDQANVYPRAIAYLFEACSPGLEVCFNNCDLFKRAVPLFPTCRRHSVFDRNTEIMTRTFTLKWTRDDQGHLSWRVTPGTASCASTMDDDDDNFTSEFNLWLHLPATLFRLGH